MRTRKNPVWPFSGTVICVSVWVMAERSHRTLGEPDFTILADRGRVLFVECKSRTGKLSPAQAALKLHAETLGHTIHLVRSYEEFLTLL